MKHKSKKSSSARTQPAAAQTVFRKWVFRLTALLLPVALLGVLEISLRLGGYGFDPHFFKRLKIGGEDYFVQNDDFSFSFFPPETARNPGPIRLPVRKAPGTFRIFILGESAAMGDPEPAYGAYRYLEMLLREKYPDKKFEVINVAFTAINSHVIVPIARECAQHEGDLWIVYMGNNEMVGPFGAATVFGKQAPPLPYVRLVTALQRTRTGQLLAAWSRKLKGHGAKATAWAGMQMFLQNQIAPASPLKENVYRNFQKNLDDIVRAGTGSGAKVLLNTVAVNLKDCPPFASLTNQNLSASDHARFEKLYAEGCRLQSSGDFAGASQIFEQAVILEPQRPDLQFNWGQCLLAQTNPMAAREHFQLACDDDALPFRADSRINDAIRNEQKTGGANLILFDAATELAAGNASKLCGQETFYEHVHFDFDGSYRLALAWAEQIEPLLPHNTNAWASQAVCEQRLGLSDWNRTAVIKHMQGRMAQPPLKGQANNVGRVALLEERVKALQSRMSKDAAAQARSDFLQTIARSPDDFMLRENHALFFQTLGDEAAAIAEWRRVRELMPHDCLSYFFLGRLLARQGQFAEAEASLRKALEIRPSLTEALLELGSVLESSGKLPESLASFDCALGQRPNDPQALIRRGKVLAKLNRHAEAMADYRVAIQLNPASWEAHYELGGELDAANQMDAAGQAFGEAVRLNSGNSRAHFNHGVLLAKQNRLDEAQREFEETLRLEPGYLKAQEYLAKLQRLRSRAP
ncbi:MAG: tetratricopeptide repeat protein [Verrucomicrobiota bacterium]